MATYIWAISKKQNENQAPRLEVESKDVKRTPWQCHMTKICQQWGLFQYKQSSVYERSS